MRLRILFFIAVIFIQSWGFKSHKKIHEIAIQQIPNDSLFQFFKRESVYIIEHAVDADVRKFSDHKEITSHFIDLDTYLKRFSEDSLRILKYRQVEYLDSSLLEHGTLPWSIKRTYYNLIYAYRKMDKKKILKYTCDLGHYISDACVPLHTNSNYNGQHSHQLGIHSLWETQIPELFLDTLVPKLDTIQYESEVQGLVWDLLFSSYKESYDVLSKEKVLRKDNLSLKTNRYGKKVFSQKYRKDYSERLNMKVHERLLKSANVAARLWYSAWIDAGQPKLPS
jgi:hypothetical protein